MTCSAFITACNPHSQQVCDAVNAARQADLARELARRGTAFVPGIGQHLPGGWSGESSFLVFDLVPAAACGVDRRFEQNVMGRS